MKAYPDLSQSKVQGKSGLKLVSVISTKWFKRCWPNLLFVRVRRDKKEDYTTSTFSLLLLLLLQHSSKDEKQPLYARYAQRSLKTIASHNCESFANEVWLPSWRAKAYLWHLSVSHVDDTRSTGTTPETRFFALSQLFMLFCVKKDPSPHYQQQLSITTTHLLN